MNMFLYILGFWQGSYYNSLEKREYWCCLGSYAVRPIHYPHSSSIVIPPYHIRVRPTSVDKQAGSQLMYSSIVYRTVLSTVLRNLNTNYELRTARLSVNNRAGWVIFVATLRISPYSNLTLFYTSKRCSKRSAKLLMNTSNELCGYVTIANEST